MNRALCSAALVLLAGAAASFAQSSPAPSSIPSPQPPVLVLTPGQQPPAAHGPNCVTPVDASPEPSGMGLYGSAEYLLWWLSGSKLPPLVTTGPATFPVGFLGNPGVTILFGNSTVDQGPFSGGQFLVGYWLDCDRKTGVEVSGFFLGQQSRTDSFNSMQFPVLTRPFVNANENTPFSEFAAFPGLAGGSIEVRNASRLWGIGPRVRCTLCCGECSKIDAIAGFQYVDLEESLSIVERVQFSPDVPDPNLANSRFVATDSFATRNQFYGGLIGLDAWMWRGSLALNAYAQISLGSTHQSIDIQGQQVKTDAAGTTTVFPGALLALPGANIGRFHGDTFSVLPRAGVNLGYRIGENLTVYGGYSVLYWNNVVRPGEQIDLNLDVNRIPNFGVVAPPLATTRPTVPFARTDFWAHGINVGVGVVW